MPNNDVKAARELQQTLGLKYAQGLQIVRIAKERRIRNRALTETGEGISPRHDVHKHPVRVPLSGVHDE